MAATAEHEVSIEFIFDRAGEQRSPRRIGSMSLNVEDERTKGARMKNSSDLRPGVACVPEGGADDLVYRSPRSEIVMRALRA
jgi:hypothetical protein